MYKVGKELEQTFDDKVCMLIAHRSSLIHIMPPNVKQLSVGLSPIMRKVSKVSNRIRFRDESSTTRLFE